MLIRVLDRASFQPKAAAAQFLTQRTRGGVHGVAMVALRDEVHDGVGAHGGVRATVTRVAGLRCYGQRGESLALPAALRRRHAHLRGTASSVWDHVGGGARDLGDRIP